jgi:lipid II:glycine glycyltransferase (peptidoglycan interpeptide bridge formation enzyme)
VAFLQFRSGVPRPGLDPLGFERSEPVLISETVLDQGDPWTRVSPDNRQSIRKAQRRGVTIREASSLEDYQAFYRIYLNAFRAFGTPPYGPNYFPALWERLGRERQVRLLLAMLEGKIVGGLVLFAWQRNLVSKFAACEPEAVPARAYAALYGAAIELGLTERARRLNWGSSARHQTGLVEFKERWGAVTTPAILYSLPVRGNVPSLSAYYDESGLARRVWRRLPLGLTVHLGSVLNRWFC